MTALNCSSWRDCLDALYEWKRRYTGLPLGYAAIHDAINHAWDGLEDGRQPPYSVENTDESIKVWHKKAGENWGNAVIFTGKGKMDVVYSGEPPAQPTKWAGVRSWDECFEIFIAALQECRKSR